MPRKWNLSLTYKPKIEAVRNHECTQTIRKKGKIPKRVGDLVSFHGYENGRGTPWTWRTPYKPLELAKGITILNKGIILGAGNDEFPTLPLEPCSHYCCKLWVWEELDWLAKLDFISPPTGEALRDVLVGMNGKIPEEGIEAQILRWS